MIRLSIIVPVTENQAATDATVLSVLENRPSNSEVILACWNSYDDPYDLTDEVTFVRGDDGTSVIDLLNLGLANSSGDYLHWLLPGVRATAGWTDSAVELLVSRTNNYVAPLILDEQSSSRLVSAGVCYRSRGTKVDIGKGVRFPSRKAMRLKADGPSILSGFCRAEAINTFGNFHSAIGDAFADADFASRLKRADERCAVDTSSVLVGSRVTECEPGFWRARYLERLFWKNADRKLVIVPHAVHVCGDTVKHIPTMLSSLFGRFVGMCDAIRGIDQETSLSSSVRRDVRIDRQQDRRAA